MIRPGILIRGKINTSIIREYPELENIEITPTIEDQTYTPTKYGFEEVKVKGVQAYIDEDIKPEYIKDGVDILGVIGNVVELQGEEKTIIPSTTQQIIVPSDGKNGMTRLTVEAVDSSIDENIKPENIKEGTNILGIDGQYRGIDTSNATATANDILKDKTAYSQNEEITGTIETYDGSYEGNAIEDGLKITDASYLFYGGARIDYLNEILRLCDGVTNMQYMFYDNNVIENVILFDTGKVENMYRAFAQCPNLVSIPKCDASKVTNVSQMFYFSDFPKYINFTTLGGFENLGKTYTQKTANYSSYRLELSNCAFLTHESLMNVINGLYDLNLTYDVANGGTLYRQSLVLGATNLAKLTEEEIAIATNKGWDVS